jgi:predicted PurR-regulated permease PerM
VQIQITVRTWLSLFALGLALMATWQMGAIVVSISLLLILGALLSLLLYPLAEQLEQLGIHRGFTVFGILVLVVLMFSFLAIQILPLLSTTIAGLAQLIETLEPQFQQTFDIVPVEQLLTLASAMLQTLARNIGSIAAQITSAFWFLFVTIVIVFGLVTDRSIRAWLLRFFVPPLYRTRVVRLTRAVSAGLARWFLGQSAISGYYILTYAAVNLWLGIPFAIPIAMIAGLLEFIPYLGGIVGLVLSLLAAATVSNSTVLWILICNTIIGGLCVVFVSPFFLSRAVKVPVAAILFGLFVGGQVGGFFAALLAVPCVTIITILIRELRPLPEERETPDQSYGSPTSRP